MENSIEKNVELNSLSSKVVKNEEELQKIQVYLDSLTCAVNSKEEDNHNIAIMGAYGSGKSTVINTFLDKNKNKKGINISLAAFNKKSESINESNINLERELELRILKQLCYQASYSEVPHSRFNRIINLPWHKKLSYSFSILIWLYSLFALFKFDYLDKMNPSQINFNYSFNFIAFIIISCFISGSLFLIYKSIGLFFNSKIKKLNIKGEVELANKSEQSIFNEYLDEIFYFFERTKIEIVVFEDLDRFQSTDIFTNLRELNHLLNKNTSIGQNVIFIYALRDDTFVDKLERVKFFDYIIPIIPYINPENAKEKLLYLMKQHGLENDLSKEFRDSLVSNIDDIDMRLLTNIVNEYLIYKYQLRQNNLDLNKLFSMVVFKNILPNDYAKLHKRKGTIYNFIASKDKYIKLQLNKINKKILSIENDIKNKLDDVKLQSHIKIVDLKKIALFEILMVVPNIQYFYINNEQYSLKDIMEGDKFRYIFNVEKVKYIKSTNCNIDNKFNYNEIEKIENILSSYKKRYDEISGELNRNIENKKIQLQELIKNKYQIKKMNLNDVVNKISNEELIELIDEEYHGDIFGNKLIEYILRNGYLGEDYCDYITIFYGEGISKKDYFFVRNIKNNQSNIFDYQLDDLDYVVENIDSRFFSQHNILNIYILEYLLSHNNERNSIKLNAMIELLSNKSNRSIEFIELYIQHTNNLGSFLNKLCKKWGGILEFVINESNYSEGKISDYFSLIIAYVEDLELLNKNNILKDYIENNFNILVHIDEDKAIEVIEQFNIKFNRINIQVIEQKKKLLNNIYNGNHYEININNILDIMKLYDIDTEIEPNYSTIRTSSLLDKLNDYINENIEIYLANVFLKLPNNNSEKEEFIEEILNNNELSLGLKGDIIDSQKTKISNIDNIINIEVKELLFLKNKIKPSWHNVQSLYYSNEDNLDTTNLIVEFLNNENNASSISAENLIDTESKDYSFEYFISKCNQLNNKVYSYLINKTDGGWNDFDFQGLDYEKVLCLIKNNKITLNSNNIHNLREVYPKIIILLIENNYEYFNDEIIDKFNECTFLHDELSDMFSSKIIELSNKKLLLDKINLNDISGSAKLANSIALVMIEINNLEFHFELVITLINSTTHLESKLKLLNIYSEKFSNNEIQQILEQLPAPYPKIFKKKHKPTFMWTEENKVLFENLKERELISSWKEKNNKSLMVVAKYN